jgi:hypothetical protein
MGWKGTGKCLCSSCKSQGIIKHLTEGNCSPSVFKKRAGDCRACMAKQSVEWRKNNPEKRKQIEKRSYEKRGARSVKKYNRTPRGKHKVLIYKTQHEGIPKEDLLLSLNFYVELIRDNECHYCLGPLNPTSHSLDCMENELGHLCFNVAPCCKSCKQKKMNDTSYEEMMLLAPVLREIRRRREIADAGTVLS